jgi:hypothetical protein
MLGLSKHTDTNRRTIWYNEIWPIRPNAAIIILEQMSDSCRKKYARK